jgi:hypothetical protein
MAQKGFNQCGNHDYDADDDYDYDNEQNKF